MDNVFDEEQRKSLIETQKFLRTFDQVSELGHHPTEELVGQTAALINGLLEERSPTLTGPTPNSPLDHYLDLIDDAGAVDQVRKYQEMYEHRIQRREALKEQVKQRLEVLAVAAHLLEISVSSVAYDAIKEHIPEDTFLYRGRICYNDMQLASMDHRFNAKLRIGELLLRVPGDTVTVTVTDIGTGDIVTGPSQDGGQ